MCYIINIHNYIIIYRLDSRCIIWYLGDVLQTRGWFEGTSTWNPSFTLFTLQRWRQCLYHGLFVGPSVRYENPFRSKKQGEIRKLARRLRPSLRTGDVGHTSKRMWNTCQLLHIMGGDLKTPVTNCDQLRFFRPRVPRCSPGQYEGSSPGEICRVHGHLSDASSWGLDRWMCRHHAFLQGPPPGET